jgi:hypothetical protein
MAGIKLLVWNIDKFGKNHISTELYRNYIIDNIKKAKPDIIVIVEAMGEITKLRGQLKKDDACCMALINLRKLIKDVIGGEWYIVPPLSLVGQEGKKNSEFRIAVLFNSKKMWFTGPNYWNGTQTASFPDKGTITVKFYPGSYKYFLPNEEVYIPEWTKINQRSLAGMVISNVWRGLWYTRFELKDGTNRIIQLFSIHGPSKLTSDNERTKWVIPVFFKNLSKIFRYQWLKTIDDKTIRILAGDFNSSPQEGRLKELQKQEFWRIFNAPISKNWAIDTRFTYIDKREAKYRIDVPKYWRNKNGWSFPYSGQYWENCIDNILLRFNKYCHWSNATILDRVSGMTGYPYIMNTSMPDIAKDMKFKTYNENWNYGHQTFFKPENYGHIKDTSDHLAVVVDIENWG